MAKQIPSSGVSDLIEWQKTPGVTWPLSRHLEHFGLSFSKTSELWALEGNAEARISSLFHLLENSSWFWPRVPSSLWRTNPSHVRALFSNRWLHILTGLFVTEETGPISHFKPEEAIVTAIIAGEWGREIRSKIKAGLLASHSSLRFLLICWNLLDAFRWRKLAYAFGHNEHIFLFHIMKNIKK